MTGRKRTVFWWFLLLLTAALVALWILPARWLMAWIPESSPIVITDASGTLWNANATLAVGSAGLRRSLPDPVRWRLAWAGGPRLMISHPWLRGPLALAPSWRGLRVSGQSLQLPAFALTTMHSMLNTLDPDGELHLQWPDLTLAPGAMAATGTPILTVQWRNASSSLTRLRPMGQYTFTVVQDKGRSLALSLSTLQGPLMLQGKGTLPASGAARFDGRAWVDRGASDQTRAALRALLDALGHRQGPDDQVLLRIP